MSEDLPNDSPWILVSWYQWSPCIVFCGYGWPRTIMDHSVICFDTDPHILLYWSEVFPYRSQWILYGVPCWYGSTVFSSVGMKHHIFCPIRRIHPVLICCNFTILIINFCSFTPRCSALGMSRARWMLAWGTLGALSSYIIMEGRLIWIFMRIMLQKVLFEK